jgi:hypothetical protein
MILSYGSWDYFPLRQQNMGTSTFATKMQSYPMQMDILLQDKNRWISRQI